MTAEPLLSDLPVVTEPRSEQPRTAEIIRSSWELVEPRSEPLGRHFYGTLFRLAPGARELFPVSMEAQRSRLLRALVHVVQSVDRPDDIVPFLEHLGRDHRKFDVIAEHYEALGVALISAIRAFSGEAWTPDVEQAWTEAYSLVADTMIRAAEADRGPAS